ncbi:expressed unknown protein [Seminavis robusta]|uniref:Uncharacterized protein n=1 Tax=Seminavis robusta TaxID=568900 RepID=A0A9N8E0I4_9STRA|nr:expressed unknown protein [Seminavis robusta]|eukprot:Sro503_g155842.1  (394) ;mRNA; f:45529-46710
MSVKRDYKRVKRELEEDPDCESKAKSNGDGEEKWEGDQSTQTCHAEKKFHHTWVGVIQRSGTTKLPKKSWMNTHCMKLNSKQKRARIGEHDSSYHIPTIMMRGTNMPSKEREKDSVDSICRTEGCIVPDHHRWLLQSEKFSRQCCGANLMCSTCHVEISFPCSHDPACQWRVSSIGDCKDCRKGGSRLKSKQEAAATFESIQTTRKRTDTIVSHPQRTKRHKKLKKEKNCTTSSTRTGTPSQLADNALLQEDKNFRKSWVRVIQDYGTTKLQRKPWMKTLCMKLDSKQQHVFVNLKTYAKGVPIKFVMMRGTNMPCQPKNRYSIDSTCRTPNCIIADHHRWMPRQEKWSRESCGASLMCPTCHLEIPMPCSHNPPCEWRVVSKEMCSVCQSQE